MANVNIALIEVAFGRAQLLEAALRAASVVGPVALGVGLGQQVVGSGIVRVGGSDVLEYGNGRCGFFEADEQSAQAEAALNVVGIAGE